MTTIAAAAADVDVDAEVTDAEIQRCRYRCRIGSHPKNNTIEPKEVETRVSFFVQANKDLLASKQLRDWLHNNC